MARPRKSDFEKRTAHLPPVRLTDAELAAIAGQAQTAGLSVSEYARQRLLTGRVTAAPSRSQGRLLSELNRCGVNLNQVARHLNSGAGQPGKAGPDDLGIVLAELHRVLMLVGRSYGA
jgi:hypothetical protein